MGEVVEVVVTFVGQRRAGCIQMRPIMFQKAHRQFRQGLIMGVQRQMRSQNG